MKQWRCYIIGYKPEWSEQNQELCEKLIEEADLCIIEERGVKIGHDFSTYTIIPGKGKKDDDIPNHLTCIGHEHGGKIAIVIDKYSN